jgi:carbamoyl-phosphate synthase
MVHKNRPFFSVQFHPEAKCGPDDTAHLFDKFLALCRGKEASAPALRAARLRAVLEADNDTAPSRSGPS